MLPAWLMRFHHQRALCALRRVSLANYRGASFLLQLLLVLVPSLPWGLGAHQRRLSVMMSCCIQQVVHRRHLVGSAKLASVHGGAGSIEEALEVCV